MQDGDEVVGHVGSNNDKAVWQELGTSRGIPPRSFLVGAAMRMERRIHQMAYRRVIAAFSGRGASARDWKETMHILEMGGHAIKKAWEDLTEPPKEERDDNR
jgi:hypothetical protein